MLLAVYQFQFDPLSWYVAIAWIVLGFIAYSVYFEKESGAAAPRVLEALTREPPREAYRILIPVANPETVSALLRLAVPVARAKDGDIAATTTVEVPIQLPIQEGMKYINHRQPLLRAAQALAQELDFSLTSDIRIAHKVEEGIVSAADDLRADLLFMGWKGFTSTRERIFGEIMDRVIHRVRGDVVVVKLRGDAPFKRILLPTSGGPHAEFAAELLEPIVAETGAKVTACYVIPEGASDDDEQEARRWVERTLRHVNLGEVDIALPRAGSVAGGIARLGSDFDLIVIGAAKVGMFKHLLFGEIPERVGRFAQTSVMLVKRREGPARTWLRRMIS